MSGIQNHSSAAAGESYVIFSIDQEADAGRAEAFEGWLRRLGIGYRRLTGSYKGTTERAWIVNADKWTDIRGYGWTVLQESVLVLGPINGAGGTRPAILHFLLPRVLPVSLGYLVEVPQNEAEAEEAWTREECQREDGATFHRWYICKHRPHRIA